MIRDWHENIKTFDIPIVSVYRIDSNLSNDIEISSWSSQGLSSDEFSVQNAILTLRSSRFPLCIDPQHQALSWIKKREAHNNLRLLNFSDPDFIKILELSMKYGSPVLFQDVDEYIDPIIGNLLEKKFVRKQGQMFAILGGKQILLSMTIKIILLSFPFALSLTIR